MRRAALLLLASCLLACGEEPRQALIRSTGGDATRAPHALRRYGCTACHVIPGVPTAHGKVGPALVRESRRAYIAGHLPNTPANMVAFLREPTSLVPGTIMPDMGVTEQDARDMVAFLYLAP
jgi:cytochrome c